ncbi:MAG TPA: putative DNA-binding protein [Limnochordia bacterium]|nr:putative DNA-binding protein [Limnochordia bacterium]
MDKTLRMSLLFDFYGPLLTDRQQDIFQLYYNDDLSLGEIAEELRISRQAVYDTLRRVGLTLEEFEQKLGLVQKDQERQRLYGEILGLVNQLRSQCGELPALQGIEERIQKARGAS